MIKFFRNIRRNLIRENRFTRYLIYAIGEIILVVIGILIALQINNWNEANKNKAFEIRMLKELSAAINTDIYTTREVILNYRIREKEKSVEYFKKLLKKDSVDKDSLHYYFNWITTGLLFHVNKGPYEGLKSMGLDKISNDSIRNKVQLLYDSTIPKLEELTEWVETNYGNEQEELLEQYSMATTYKIENDTVYFRTPLKSYEFWEESDFLRALLLAEARSRYNRSYFNDLLTEFLEMKKMIDLEINKLKNS